MEKRIDRLMSMDIGGRGVEPLYRAAREMTGGPLAMAAARRLSEFSRGDVVLFTTGFLARAGVSPNIGENDGPAGTAVLARTLQKAFGILPVVVTDDPLRPAIGAVLQTAGFNLVSLEEARRALEVRRRTAVVVVLPYPAEDEEALRGADPLLDELQPRAVVSVERAGRNVMGRYHDMRGSSFDEGQARTDLLVEKAQSRGIPLIAVGDGGNEIGMGLVMDAVREHVPYGRSCQCSCGRGIAARSKADVLVTAAVSNWGCYAVAACIAILMKNHDLLHTVQAEQQLIAAGVRVGLINSVEGAVDGGVDGLPADVQVAVVQLLHTMAALAIDQR
ncbi:MAG: DUF4392 domain-containing protein [Chloroflexota bacterium]